MSEIISDLITERLIVEVEVRPGLYNLQLPEYSNRNVKVKLWEEVCQQIFPEWANFEENEKTEKGKVVCIWLNSLTFITLL